MVRPRVLWCALPLALLGCSVTTTYETTTTVFPTRVEGAFRDHRYRVIATGVTGSAHAPVDDPASTRLATRAMDALVAAAKLGPGQACRLRSTDGRGGELRVGRPKSGLLRQPGDGTTLVPGQAPELDPARETSLQVLAETKPHDVAATLPESFGAGPGKLLELVFYATQNVAVDACAVVPLSDELPPPPPAPWQPTEAAAAGLARLSLHEPALDGGDRADDSPVVRGQKAHEGDHQQAGVQLAPPEILYEGAKLCVEAARARRRVDLGANPAPVLHRALEAEVFDAAHGAVEREPRHHLRVREMPPRTADLPDPLVRSVPVVNHEIDERPLELPGRLLGRDSRRLRQVQSGHDLTVDVELELLRCGVADPDRARAGVPREPGQLGLGDPTPRGPDPVPRNHSNGSGGPDPVFGTIAMVRRTGSGERDYRDG
jgi:hypothetical protein